MLAVAAITEIAACLEHRLSFRAVPALAADFGVWLLVEVMTSAEGVPEGYHPARPLTISILCLALLAIYGGSIGVRSFALRQRISVFELAQGVLAFALATFGILRATQGSASWALGILFLLLSAAFYWGALSYFADEESARNRRVSATWARFIAWRKFPRFQRKPSGAFPVPRGIAWGVPVFPHTEVQPGIARVILFVGSHGCVPAARLRRKCSRGIGSCRTWLECMDCRSFGTAVLSHRGASPGGSQPTPIALVCSCGAGRIRQRCNPRCRDLWNCCWSDGTDAFPSLGHPNDRELPFGSRFWLCGRAL